MIGQRCDKCRVHLCDDCWYSNCKMMCPICDRESLNKPVRCGICSMMFHVKDITECCICCDTFCNSCMLCIAHPCICTLPERYLQTCSFTLSTATSTNINISELRQQVHSVIDKFFFHDIMCADFAFLEDISSKNARFVKHSSNILCLIDNVKNVTSDINVYDFPGDSYRVACETFDPYIETCEEDITRFLEQIE